MSRRVLLAAAFVFVGATNLLLSPRAANATEAFGSCNMSLPFPCAYSEPWEAEARCDAVCPNWTFWTCGTTALTCWGEPE